MGDKTGIQWTHHTWNPWYGCKKISPGCANCYMFSDMRRYGKEPSVVKRASGHSHSNPLRWNTKARLAGGSEFVFTCSWSDFFIDQADSWRDDAWGIVVQCPHLTFQILTKRPERIAEHLPRDWGKGWPNVWLGVSVENAAYADRINLLREIPAAIRFVSYEPALGSLGDVDLTGFDWFIAGGESGSNARPNDLYWHREALANCRRQGVAYFEKQLGRCCTSQGTSGWPTSWLNQDRRYRRDGNLAIPLCDSHGSDPEEWPADLRVREFPALSAGAN